jgi:hypothetical protein
MDTSAGSARIIRGPLTDVEKKRRRNNNLCTYYGGAGHFLRDCPKKPKINLTARAAAVEEKVEGEQGKEQI